MKSRKKKIGNALFLAIVFLLTIYSVFHGEDFTELIKAIREVNLWYILLAVGAVLFFIWSESIIIKYMFRTLSLKVRKRTCFLYSCIGFFFSCITPFASGGQPAQAYYMHKNKIPIPIATVVLMIITMTYKSVLVFIGLFVTFFQRDFVHKYLEGILPIFYLGVVLNILCCVFISLFAFSPDITKKILLKGMRMLERIHILKKNNKREIKLEESMKRYGTAAEYFRNHKMVIGNVVLITFVQRMSLFFVTWFVYKSFGLTGTSLYDVVMLQAVISVAVELLPLPGGMGVSENLFLIVFKNIFIGSLLLPGMVLSRGIAFYVQLLFCALVTGIAHFTIGYAKTE